MQSKHREEKAMIADSVHSCFHKCVAFGKEQIFDFACAALIDLNEEMLPIAAAIFQ
jgi:hypothetical protein